VAEPSSALAVVLVCHNNAAHLQPGLAAISEQLEPDDELVVVDNASDDGSIDLVNRVAPRARCVPAGRNLGFAGGGALGARETRAPLLLFLNPDAIPAPGALRALRDAAARRPEWGAWQALVTLDDGKRVNTAGNVAHYLGIGWAGGLAGPVDDVDHEPHEVGFASGAALAVRRQAWDRVGGFDPRFFMYCEDLDLSLRLRLAGWRVGVVPEARVAHNYDFDKGDYKWFYLERNRWWTLLGVYPGPLLALLAPALAVFELAVMAGAWRGGWLGAKLRAQGSVVRELPAILRRRRAIQATRTVTTRDFAGSLSASMDSPYLATVGRLPGVAATQRAFFALVLTLLGRRR
jgi:N-acetylglucosaminyl-diphospho-decaprenol L-rhamnosyltransferase